MINNNHSKENSDDNKEPLHGKKDSLKFSDPEKQKKVMEKLGELNPGLRNIYKGMLISLGNKSNPERISQTAHSIRELTTILPSYTKEVLPVEEKVTRADTITNQEDQKNVLRNVIRQHPARAKLPTHLHEAFIKNWIDLHKWFTKHAHHQNLRNKVSTKVDEKEFSANVWYFEDLLYRVLIETPFFEPISEIDELLKVQSPSKENVDTLIRLIEQEGHYRYFFEKCENSLWIKPLLERGFFKGPRQPIKEGGYIRFLIWPESKFLARVAHKSPEEVYEIIKELNADNQSVLDDFVEAALNSPVATAVKYVDLIEKNKWIQNPYNLRLPDKIADLMEKLATEEEFDEAIQLAKVLFELRVDQPLKFDGEPVADKLLVTHPDAKPYFDEWRFNEVIKKKTKKLSKARPVALFEVYLHKLHDAIRLERRENKPDDFYEYSHIWRPNLSRAHHKHEDAKNILIDGLMDLIEQNKNNPSSLKNFIAVLQRHVPALFRRMEMFIYNIQPDDFIKEGETILKNKQIILAYNLRREYLPLLGNLFNKIPQEAQQEILEVISTGPDIHKRDDQTQEHFDHISDDWRGLYFAPIKKYLPEHYKQAYQKIIKRYGESQDDDGEIKTWNGGKSPIASDKLAELDSAEVIEYLGSYVEPNDPFNGFSSGGLGMTFAGVVTESPEKYVDDAKLLLEKKIRPLYIYQFLYGLKEALRKNKCFDWDPVIGLCHQIINLEISDLAKPASQHEQGWHSVKRAMADLLGEVLGTKRCEIPIELREKVWEIIFHLTEDEEPTPEDEKRDRESSLDPMSSAINTVRGEAMHAVVNYGLWLVRNQKETDSKEANKMPVEMQELLDMHLDTSKDPSLAIRSVYGSRLPNLFYLDREWTKGKIDTIFPRGESEKPLFVAAIDGYISNNVYFDIFKVLKNVYKDGIAFLDLDKDGKGYRVADIDERLPQHLMVAYIHESKHDDLISYFFKEAPAKARGQAINFVGRVILKELIAYENRDVVKKRVMELWDQRLENAKGDFDIEELQEFGWWFKRSPFEKNDTINKLLDTLEITKGVIDVPYEIIEELRDYASDYPLETITVLDLIARAEREYHEFSYKSEEYKEVIRRVKKSGNTDAIQKADALIHFIGSQGLIDFRELL